MEMKCERQPAVFVSWDSAADAVCNDTLDDALRSFGGSLIGVDAIVVMASHVPTSDDKRASLVVNGAARPKLLYDFYGFPSELNSLKYAASGWPDLVSRIAGRLISAGLSVRLDSERPWDHRLWMPLRAMFPKANVPIVEISAAVGVDRDPLFRAGRALAFLRDRGILLMATTGPVLTQPYDTMFFVMGTVRDGDRIVYLPAETEQELRLALAA